MKLMKYLNKRGGRIVLTEISQPEVQSNVTASEAMEIALNLEKKVNQVRNVII
jgi:ferritin heavy chain